jgi:hypothetical protein
MQRIPRLRWSYGLSQFLRHSNEDGVCSAFVGKLTETAARRLWPTCQRAIKIADIGCGQASKAVRIATYLAARGLRTDWDLVDIDGRWRSSIDGNIQRAEGGNQINFNVQCPFAAETWLESIAIAPDIAQFIHVPYDDETEEMVFSTTMELALKQSFILISTEHPRSDLNTLRRRMSKLGYKDLPSERTTSLATRLKQAGLLVKPYVLSRKYLEVGDVNHISDKRWFWDLVFGTRRSNYDKAELGRLIREIGSSGYIPSLGVTMLNIPDLLITVRQRV